MMRERFVAAGRPLWRFLSYGMLALILTGCAAQRAHQEGQLLLAAGDHRGGLSKLQEAAKQEPSNLAYRLRHLQARDMVVQELLARAATSTASQRYDVAESLYKEVLFVHPANDKALAELRQLDKLRRWDKLVAEASSAAGRTNWEAAHAALKSVLTESPRHAAALALMAQVEREMAAGSAPPALSDAYRKPITIDFKDASLKTVFEVIARTSGLNFVFDKDVKVDQKTSIYLRNSTIQAAVELTLLTNQLDQRVLNSNSLLIYPNTQAKQKEYQPLTIKSFYLSNAEAKTVANTLKTLLKTRDVVADEKLNLVVVRDTAEAVRLAEKLVALHDVPDPEVMLEVEILEVKRTKLMDLGVRWPDQLSLAPLASQSGGALTLADLRNLSSETVGATVSPLTINARKTDSLANILANPRIRVRNREKAKILIGERVPNITTTSTSTGFVADSVSYVDVGLKLEVEPVIYPDGEVVIKAALEVSNVVNQTQTKSGSTAYQIGTRNANTVLRLKDGENQVLAGLINDEDRQAAYKVPALGEMPLLGRLFASQSDNNTKTEIVLSITPRIVRNIVRPDASILEFDSGTESSVKGWGAGAAVAATPAYLERVPGGNAAGAHPLAARSERSDVAAQSGAPSGAASGIALGGASTTAPSAEAGAGALEGGAAPSNFSGSVEMRWQGPTQLKVGDTFALQLMVRSEGGVVAAPLSIAYDPQILQVVAVTEGDYFSRDGTVGSFSGRIDGNGRVLVMARSGAEAGAAGSGALLTLNMKVLAADSGTRVQVVAAAPVGVGGRALTAPLPPPQVINLQP